jgi:hypothetical protein
VAPWASAVGERGVHKRGGIHGTGENRRGGGGDDRSDEFAAPENTFIKGPPLASTAQPSPMLPETETASQPTAVEIGGRLSERVSVARAIQTPGRPDGGGKLPQDKISILPGASMVPQQDGMAGPGVLIEGVGVGDHASPQEIEVNVAHGFEHVGVGVDEDGLEAALEEVADAAMAGVERACIPAEQALHGTGERHRAGTEQEMHAGGHQCPGVDREARGGGEVGEAIEEVGAIGVVAKDGAAVDTASNHVVKRIGGIKARSAWHAYDYTACAPQYNRPLQRADLRWVCSDCAL